MCLQSRKSPGCVRRKPSSFLRFYVRYLVHVVWLFLFEMIINQCNSISLVFHSHSWWYKFAWQPVTYSISFISHDNWSLSTFKFSFLWSQFLCESGILKTAKLDLVLNKTNLSLFLNTSVGRGPLLKRYHIVPRHCEKGVVSSYFHPIFAPILCQALRYCSVDKQRAPRYKHDPGMSIKVVEHSTSFQTNISLNI